MVLFTYDVKICLKDTQSLYLVFAEPLTQFDAVTLTQCYLWTDLKAKNWRVSGSVVNKVLCIVHFSSSFSLCLVHIYAQSICLRFINSEQEANFLYSLWRKTEDGLDLKEPSTLNMVVPCYIVLFEIIVGNSTSVCTKIIYYWSL